MILVLSFTNYDGAEVLAVSANPDLLKEHAAQREGKLLLNWSDDHASLPDDNNGGAYRISAAKLITEE